MTMLESQTHHHHHHHRVAHRHHHRRVAHRHHHHRVARHLAKIQNMKPAANLLNLLRNSSSNGGKWV